MAGACAARLRPRGQHMAAAAPVVSSIPRRDLATSAQGPGVLTPRTKHANSLEWKVCHGLRLAEERRWRQHSLLSFGGGGPACSCTAAERNAAPHAPRNGCCQYGCCISCRVRGMCQQHRSLSSFPQHLQYSTMPVPLSAHMACASINPQQWLKLTVIFRVSPHTVLSGIRGCWCRVATRSVCWPRAKWLNHLQRRCPKDAKPGSEPHSRATVPPCTLQQQG